MDLEETIAEAAAGDRRAFATLVGRLQQPLFGYLGRLGLTPALVEEIAQEAFVRAWRHLDQFDMRRAAFSTWLFAIARNLALDELARPARRLEQTYGDAPPEVVAVGADPLTRLEARRNQARLDAAIRHLAPRDRSLLALSCIAGFEPAEVARIEGMTVGALRTRMHRIRARLRGLLENTDG